MRNCFLLLLLIACVGCCSRAKQANTQSQVIVTTYPSSVGEAGVSVYLPEGYATSKTDYPVLTRWVGLLEAEPKRFLTR